MAAAALRTLPLASPRPHVSAERGHTAHAQVRTECQPKYLALHDTNTLKTAKIEAYLASWWHRTSNMLKATSADDEPGSVVTSLWSSLPSLGSFVSSR